MVTELAARGADAVEPLLACLESDPRLTQSVHYWRDFNRSRTILGVHEAALYALQALLHADFFELASTGDSLSGRGEDYRKKLAALIRANWEKYGKTGGPQRSYRILLDDAAGADAWIDAANSLLHKVEYDEDTGQAIPPKGPLPGEGLRELHDPSISDLLEKRIREVGKAAAAGDEDPHRARLALLAALLDWDLPRGRESIRKQTASWLKNRTWSKEPAAILARFVQEVSDRVPEILPLFEDMAWTLAPEKYDNSNSQPVFVTQMILQHGNALKRKGKELWTDGESPWCLRKLGRDDLENVMTYWRDQKLLATPPFRELAIAALEDGSKCSEAGVDAEDPTQWYQHVAGGKVTRRIPDGKETKFALKPGKPLPIRRKDVAGRALKLSGEVGEEPKEPVLEYYWSLQERDEWLKKYSQELQKPAPPPPGK